MKLSKPFYLTSPLVNIVASIILGVGVFFIFRDDPSAGWPLVILGSLGALYATIVAMVLCYKMWQAIQDGHARTTPGKAVGFLFIPLFNCYWIFQVFWGFSKDYNAYLDRHSINARKLQEGIFLTFCIIPFTTWIPFVGIVTSIAYCVLLFLIIFQICDAVNALPATAAESIDHALPDQPLQRRVSPILRAGSFSLYCINGEYARETVVIPPEGVSIGRDPARANLVLTPMEISGIHARVVPEPKSSQLLLEDLQSLNGTFYSQQNAQAPSPGWVKLQGKVLLSPGAKFRLAEDGPEFEIRAA